MAMSNHPEGALYRHCMTCNVEQDLLRCAGCKVAPYCSKEHQAAHWPSHKALCTAVKRCRKTLDREETALHGLPDDGSMSRGDPFLTGVDHFWGIHETRTYMRARFALADAILHVDGLDAVEEAADHLLHMLQLSRGDNMGVRDLVPALLLRMGKDQACYDFVTWWKVTGQDARYDWGDMALPYLDTKDADVLEPVDDWGGNALRVSHNVAATLLKIRLLLAVKKAVRSTTATLGEGEARSPETLHQIQDSLLRRTLGGRWEAMGSAQRAQLVDTLSSQVDKLYDVVNKGNTHFWRGLLDPEKHLSTRPDLYSPGSANEMRLVLQYNYKAWKESPGAIEVIRAKYRG